MLSDEAAIVIERLNGEEVTRATLLRLAISAVLSKEGGRHFDRQIGVLNIETLPHEGEPKKD